MNKYSPRNKLFIAAAGGLAGFFILIMAGMTYFVLAVRMGGFGFGAGLLSPSESFIISVIVSALVSLGAGIPAWVLGASRWRGVLAGLVAMSVFTYISSKGHDINYGPFIEYDTLAYISAILVSTVIAIIGKNKIRLGGIAILIALTLEILRLKSVLQSFYLYNEQVIGFVASLLTWIFYPLIAAFFVTLEQKEQLMNESIKIVGSKVAGQFQIPKLLSAMIGGIILLAVIFSILQYQESRKLSTPDLIQKAYTEGKISEEERLLYLAYALHDYEKLPAKYHGKAPWSGTMIGLELHKTVESKEEMCKLSPFTRSELKRVLKIEGATCDT